MIRISRLVVLCGILLQSSFGIAQTDTEERQEKEKSLQFNFNAQGALMRNFSGGITQGSAYMARIHATLALNTENAGMWKGGEFKINVVNAHGGTPTADFIGDFQPISRNEAIPRTGLFELWYRQSFGNTSILIGQHDMNSSFGTSAYGGHSINSAFGMYPSITPNTGGAFSIFPRTMPTVYLKHDGDKVTVQGAVYAGASQPFDDDPHNIKWDLKDSRFIVGEIHYKNMDGDFQKGLYKLGVIKHSGTFLDVTDLSEASTSEAGTGVYFIADHMLVREDSLSDQGFGFFFEAGMAKGNHNLTDRFVAGGIVYKGMFPGRDEDELFFGILNSSINDDIPDGSYPDGSFYDESSRTSIELNYIIKLGKYFAVQPDFQYIINPGANSTLENAFLGLVRLTFNY